MPRRSSTRRFYMPDMYLYRPCHQNALCAILMAFFAGILIRDASGGITIPPTTPNHRKRAKNAQKNRKAAGYGVPRQPCCWMQWNENGKIETSSIHEAFPRPPECSPGDSSDTPPSVLPRHCVPPDIIIPCFPAEFYIFPVFSSPFSRRMVSSTARRMNPFRLSPRAAACAVYCSFSPFGTFKLIRSRARLIHSFWYSVFLLPMISPPLLLYFTTQGSVAQWSFCINKFTLFRVFSRFTRCATYGIISARKAQRVPLRMVTKMKIDFSLQGEITDLLPLIDGEHLKTLLKIARYFVQTSDREEIAPEIRKRAQRAIKAREEARKAINRAAKHGAPE